MRTDQLFKDVLQAFFTDFLDLFLPEVAEGIDPTTITFIDPELFTDIPEGQQHRADLAAQMETLNGEPRLVLVHTEVQARRQEDFGYRMWQYNVLLRLRKGVPTLSVAITLYPDTQGLSLEHYGETLFGREYRLLDYWQIGLRDLNAADYIDAGSDLAVGLAALMRSGTEGDAALKIALLRRLHSSDLDPARVFLLVNVVESFLPLSAEEEEALWAQLRSEGVTQMATTEIPWGEPTWADRVELRRTREVLLRQLRLRFGEVPDALVARIEQADPETLDEMLDRVVTAASLDEFGGSPS